MNAHEDELDMHPEYIDMMLMDEMDFALAPVADDAVICIGCKKHPNDIEEYTSQYKDFGCKSAVEMVRVEEGTFNRSNGHFYCTDCYIRVGMPLGVAP